jgi:hypothetical protein
VAALPAGLEARAVVGICRRRLTRNLAAYGLSAVPCDATIRAEVRRYFRTETVRSPETPPHAAGINAEEKER